MAGNAASRAATKPAGEVRRFLPSRLARRLEAHPGHSARKPCGQYAPSSHGQAASHRARGLQNWAISRPLARAAEIGRELNRILMPEPIYTMLLESVRWAAQRPDIGLRLRLCLDDELIDLPWECLYRRNCPPARPTKDSCSPMRISRWCASRRSWRRTTRSRIAPDACCSSARCSTIKHAGPMGRALWFDGLVRATSKIRSRLALEFAQAADSGDVGRRLTNRSTSSTMPDTWKPIPTRIPSAAREVHPAARVYRRNAGAAEWVRADRLRAAARIPARGSLCSMPATAVAGPSRDRSCSRACPR